MAAGFRDPLGAGNITASWTDPDGFFALRRFLGDADTPENLTGKRHLGVDWNADDNANERIHAAYAGNIAYVSADAGGGRGGVVMINHTLPDGSRYTTAYLHVRNIPPELLNGTKTTVARGELLGDSQNIGSGPHLHYEVRLGHQTGELGV